MNHSLSIRSKNRDASGSRSGGKHRFTMASLRGIQQPELSKKLYKLIKAQNHAIGAYEAAGKEQAAIASQLSDWGEETADDAVSEISDKLGVLLSEIAEQEDLFAQGLEDSRGVLKQIRNTESSVQPSRDHKTKIQDEIQKLKYKEPSSTKIVTLEQELVRAEAQSLVAEAQLTNITRQKFKEAYDIHTAAIIERAEKQILLAKNARSLLELLDDTPIVPGDAHATFEHAEMAKDVLNKAEVELREWQPDFAPIPSNAGQLGSNAMPAGASTTTHEASRVSTVNEEQNYAPQEQTYSTQEQTYPAQEQQTYSTQEQTYPTQQHSYSTQDQNYSSQAPTYIRYEAQGSSVPTTGSSVTSEPYSVHNENLDTAPHATAY